MDLRNQITQSITNGNTSEAPSSDAVNTGLGNLIPKYNGATYDTNAIQTVTAAEYAAIVTPDASTIYFIV